MSVELVTQPRTGAGNDTGHEPDGVVTLVGTGAATVTTTASDGSGVTAMCVVTVTPATITATITENDNWVWGEYFVKDGVTVSAEIINLWTATTDVDANDWYAAAIRWASAESILDGYGSNLFGPNDVLTREQLVTILYRYAKSKGVDVSGQTSLTGYNDAASVSGWAENAMKWAAAAGIITGKGHGTLDPKGNATRAEIATIMMRYCTEIAK